MLTIEPRIVTYSDNVVRAFVVLLHPNLTIGHSNKGVHAIAMLG